MKLERIHEYVLTTVVLGGGILAAMFLGGVSGRGQMGTLAAALFAIFAATVLLTLREKIWMLIPIFYSLSGKITIMPLPFTIRHLAILFAVGSFFLLKAFKVIRRKPTLTAIDILLVVNVVYVATVFVRNPVGIEALGSDRVGGRPYLEVVLSCGAFWVLSIAVAGPREAFLLPLLAAVGNSVEFVLNWVVNRFPSTAPILTQFYSDLITTEYENLDARAGMVDKSTQREAHFGTLGSNLALAAVSYFRPLTLVNPLFILRFILLLFALYCIFISGFRSLVVSVFAFFCLSEYFRRGIMGVFHIGLFGVPVLVLLLSMQGVLFDLPHPVQRSLSFLPARWNENAKRDAEASTEWRVEMWKQMLGTNRYIQNKWLGDGFGFTKRQLQEMYAVKYYGGVSEQQENFMIQGGVHSGPVSAIRFVGYLGLVLFIGLLLLIARQAWKLIHQSKGTPYFVLAIFVGLPAIWEPFNYIFIFGAYEGGLPRAIFAAGMLKMLENSLGTVSQPTPATAIAPPKHIAHPPGQQVPAHVRHPI